MARNVKSTGRRHALSHDVIARAALALVEEDGVAALTARRLAERVGCEAMSLYNYFAGMEEVRDAIVGLLLGEAMASVDASKAPRENVAANARAYLELSTRYPNAFGMLATRLWRAPLAVDAATRMAAGFASTGCGDVEAWRRARILGAYLNGAGLALAAWTSASASAMPATQSQADTRSADIVASDLEAGLELLLKSLSG